MYDLIIIGGSAAGVTAAIYAARRNLNFLMVTGDIGGEVATSGEIENYPGFKHTDGIELTEKLKEQLAYYSVKIEQPVFVDSIKKADGVFTVSGRHVSKGMTWRAHAVIVATGIHPRALPVPSEQKLRGKGITYCTTCDGPLYKGKVVATIGGGNSGLESALFLAAICPKVYLLHKNPAFKGDEILVRKVHEHPNIKVILSAMTTNVLGETQTAGLEYRDADGALHTLSDVRGVFVHIGQIPNSDLVGEEVVKTPTKEVVVDAMCRTNITGLFAAGDVTDVAFKQIVIAAGQGATAALAAVSYLNALPHA